MGNGNPSGRDGGQLPLHRGAKEVRGGAVFFLNIRPPFTGERGTATPQAAAAASSPYTGEPRVLPRGYSVFRLLSSLSFTGGTATPQAAVAASSPYTGEPKELREGAAFFDY